MPRLLMGFALLLEIVQPVSLRVMPRVSLRPTDVRIQIIIERHEGNRAAWIEADGSNFYRHSAWELQPNGPRVFDVTYYQLPCGAYQFTAGVRRWVGDRWQDIQASQAAEYCVQAPTGGAPLAGRP